MNGIKTAFLLTAIMVLFLLVGQALGGQEGLVIAFVLALVFNFFSYWYSDKIILRVYKAREITREQAPQLYTLVEKLVKNSGMPMPKVYVIPSSTPNAFATGRNPKNAAVAVTEGIVRLLNSEELEGVLAHELAHIRNRDILLSTIVATIVTAITYLSIMGRFAFLFLGRGGDRDAGAAIGHLLMLILAPIAAMIIQMAISRAREYMADAGGAEICGKPMALANALKKLEMGVSRAPMQEANASTAHMFIVHPFRGGGITKLFSTHPPIPERIKRLEALTRGRA
jgi:heat shock protein HtpX